jgi:hypothetical protein
MKSFTFKTYGVKTRAYYDAFISGLVPCMVTEITPTRITAKVTQTHKAYIKGDIIQSSHSMIFPKDRLFTRGFQYRINTQYAWK